ncbi:thioredoxin domain-containing protein [Croceibacterium sp. TMG7-5b_MA50]|uniref:thioredoxin domain-containing protein n=1 Tax=Croceibacterium sp. TMG7-5b_MA50 TaxID=3121290 RepID=UPI003221C129
MTTTRTLTMLAPLAMLLAACGSNTGDTPAALPSGDAIAAVPAPTGQSWTETATATPEGGFMVGNPNAPLKLVEFASHTCSHCADFAAEAAAPMEEYIASGRVSYEIRNQIHDGLDLTIAVLARCGGDPASFHPLANQAWGNFAEIFANAQANEAAVTAAMQSTGPDRLQRVAESAGLLDFFAARGIARDQAVQCLANEQLVQQIVQNSQEQSDRLGVTGTPTFFLNGARVDGTMWEGVNAALQRAGAR